MTGLVSSPGQSPGRAVVLPPLLALAFAAAATVSALAKSLMLKFFYVMGKALSGELSCPCDRSCLKPTHQEAYIWTKKLIAVLMLGLNS